MRAITGTERGFAVEMCQGGRNGQLGGRGLGCISGRRWPKACARLPQTGTEILTSFTDCVGESGGALIALLGAVGTKRTEAALLSVRLAACLHVELGKVGSKDPPAAPSPAALSHSALLFIC